MTRQARMLTPCLLASLLTLAPPAWAYLDPSTGSMVLSAIIGMFATAALAIRTYWYKLKGLFRRPQRPSRDPDVPGPDDPPTRDPGPVQD
jgi:hypothetical protein